MSAQIQIDELAGAIASGVLSAPLLKRAKALHDRLNRPVCLSVMGLPGSGKSALMDLLLGGGVLPEGLRLPTMGLRYGDTPHIEVTLPSGEKQSFDHADFAAVAELEPVFLEAALPVPALAKLSMLEVVAGTDTKEHARALRWAAKRTDMALWCTKTFGEAEQDLWAAMPDAVQDNSFLVLTGAGALRTAGKLDQRVAALDDASDGMFRSILPVDCHLASKARVPDGSINKNMMRDSGAMTLISSIRRSVDAGRQATADQAEVFLHQIGYDPEQAANSSNAPVKTPVAEVASVPVAEPVQAEPVPAEAVPMGDEARALCKQAVTKLRTDAKNWITAELDDDSLIEEITDSVIWLSEHLASDDDPALADSADAAMDAADLCQLIQLETGDTQLEDALTTVLQLKDEIEAKLAS